MLSLPISAWGDGGFWGGGSAGRSHAARSCGGACAPITLLTIGAVMCCKRGNNVPWRALSLERRCAGARGCVLREHYRNTREQQRRCEGGPRLQAVPTRDGMRSLFLTGASTPQGPLPRSPTSWTCRLLFIDVPREQYIIDYSRASKGQGRALPASYTPLTGQSRHGSHDARAHARVELRRGRRPPAINSNLGSAPDASQETARIGCPGAPRLSTLQPKQNGPPRGICTEHAKPASHPTELFRRPFFGVLRYDRRESPP